MKISAIILTKNSEIPIQKCLQSVAWCDEVIVIDDESKDTTVALAKKFGARIYVHKLNEDFSEQRNFGLAKAKEEWVLFLDSDELVSSQLAEEIRSIIDSPSSLTGYFVRRTDSMWGKQLLYGEAGNTMLVRLAKKNAGIWTGKVHEVWKIKGQVGKLRHELFHYPHPTVAEFLREINWYSTLRAKELFENGKTVAWWDIILYPKAKFIQNYFFKLGFLDGTRGFLSAVFMSLHSFLVRGKLWQLTNSK